MYEDDRANESVLSQWEPGRSVLERITHTMKQEKSNDVGRQAKGSDKDDKSGIGYL